MVNKEPRPASTSIDRERKSRRGNELAKAHGRVDAYGPCAVWSHTTPTQSTAPRARYPILLIDEVVWVVMFI